ncbi:MAG: tRNA (adenosine(37)-N6)-threonylcarbamoyltransferase complex ATPase subunit type 1 TsaE [Alphaproteobacteria bacterium]|nr:tRNA (adenosine(37)-N6)-threonylcarbamoyltransferase complex ATPase subunit type 1 TsaE [Alphaproteobacteria bacterium]
MHKYTLQELESIAQKFSSEIHPPYTILLEGEVGAGKTTFSQFFLKNILLDKNQPVTSPTFNIVQIYETIKGPVWHVDLYRLKSENEIFDLGLLEAMHGCICLIEWPELIRPFISNCNHSVLKL